jgi:hypothetical protein
MSSFLHLVGGITLLSAVCWTLSVPSLAAAKKEPVWKPLLSEEDTRELMLRARSMIQRELSDLNPQARDYRGRLKKIHATAVFLAAYAQATPKIAKDKTLAALRDTALQLSQKVGEQPDLAGAKKLAEELGDQKGDAKTKLGAVALYKFVGKREQLMYAFRTRQRGGDGIDPQLQDSKRLKADGGNGVEKKIQALAKRALSKEALKKQSEELTLLAFKVAAVAQLVLDWTPNVKGEGKKSPRSWAGNARELRTRALELAAAAKKGTPKDVKDKAGKLNAVCNKCHTVFK